MTTPCRLLPHMVGDGPHLMALDEALLDAVAADPSAAVVRTYAWATPTLSLGYFQEFADAEADPRWRGAPIVRRPTGGGALWHDREVTYAVVVPSTHPAARPSSALYHAVHEAIALHLRERGIAATLRGPFPPASGARPFLCFADRDTEDVVQGGAKIVGSAQRRRAGAVLQHGSLLLARSPATPELPGLEDLSPIDEDPAVWADFLRTILYESLDLDPRIDDIAYHERVQAEALVSSRYGNPAWTRRR